MLLFFEHAVTFRLINLLILIFSFIYFFKLKKNFLSHFLIGAAFSLILLFIYFFYVGVDIKDFIIQVILFPLTIGEGRILGDERAYESAKLLNKFTFRGTFGHFKFIILLILANLISLIIYQRKNKNIIFQNEVLFNFFIILYDQLIFHQLITANQTFIFF